MTFDKLAIVDVETTGMSPWADRVIEIGIIRIEKNKIVGTYNSLINPETHVSPFIEQFTGIRIADLESAPTFSSVKNDIYSLLEGATFVAHNARFDYGFMKSEFKREDISFSSKTLCTVKLSRRLFPQYTSHNLSAIIERFKLSCEKRHRAYDDSFVLWQFLTKINTMFSAEVLKKSLSDLLKSSYSGNSDVKRQIDELPESPGVYIFYDEKDLPLYVGKSVNIRERVISHFTNDYQSSRELSLTQAVHHIEHVRTAGELGAFLKESKTIKELAPIYNRKLREKKELVVLTRQTNKDGFSSVAIERKKKLTVDDMENVLGVFKNAKSAKETLSLLAKKYHLCPKILGIENSRSSCFAYKLELCKGACVGKETKMKYNARFLIAFYENKLFRPWPFNGPVELIEKDYEKEQFDSFMIDKWCLIGNKKSEIDAVRYDYDFDLDVYKILSSHFKKDKLKINSILLS